MDVNRRWVLLEHTGATGDQCDIHFDLLLEDKSNCRTWRLESLPVLDGSSVKATLLSPHGLKWLGRDKAPVSGGRGWARRLASGVFVGNLPDVDNEPVFIQLKGSGLQGILEIKENFCKICSN